MGRSIGRKVMKHTRPKFVVGEQVGVFSKLRPKHNCGRTEITFRRWMNQEDNAAGYIGWAYRTAHIEGVSNPKAIFFESSLRKLPKDKKLQWKHCAWQPEEVEKNG